MGFIISLIILIVLVDIVVDYFVISGIAYVMMRQGKLELNGVSCDEGYRSFLRDFNRMIIRKVG